MTCRPFVLVAALMLAMISHQSRADRPVPVKVTHPAASALDNFGSSVAVSGDTMIVGASGDDSLNSNEGSAHIYRWNGSTWLHEAELLAPADGTNAEAGMGFSVALFGDTALVGAPFRESSRGGVYVFTRTGTVWSRTGFLTGDSGGEQFGVSVALEGTFAVVGAPSASPNLIPSAGAVYIFRRQGSSWLLLRKLTAADGLSNDRFGTSVALQGDTLVVGAPNDDETYVNQGSAYVFLNAGTTWPQQAKLVAADGRASDFFGSSVAIDGDRVAVGSYLRNNGANIDQGAVYVFGRSGGVWSYEATLLAADGASSDFLGASVAISGDTVIAGCSADDVDGVANRGSARLFKRFSSTVWLQAPLLYPVAPDGVTNDQFGNAVAIEGDTVVVGSWRDDLDGAISINDAGSAWVFTRYREGTNADRFIEADARLVASDGSSGDGFGASVSEFAGLLAIGAPRDDVGINTDQGSVYLFTRTGTKWTFAAKLEAPDGAAGDGFGSSVSVSAGWRVVVGAPGDDIAGANDQGSAYIYTYSAGAWTQTAKLLASDGFARDNFGFSVAFDGNYVVVGAPSDGIGSNVNQGSAYTFFWNGSSFVQHQKLVVNGGTAQSRFGTSVAKHGPNIAIGAPGAGNPAAGHAFVFTPDITGLWTQQTTLAPTDGYFDDRFGSSVAVENDVVAVSSPRAWIGSKMRQGAVYLYSGSRTAWSFMAKITPTPLTANLGDDLTFGDSIALRGGRLLVGATGYDDYAVQEGAAYLFARSGSQWVEQDRFSLIPGERLNLFGNAVALSFDGEIIAGAVNGLVSPSFAPGTVWIYDARPSIVPLAVNNSRSFATNRLSDTLLTAASGEQITASSAAITQASTLDTLGRSIALRSDRNARIPTGATWTLSGGSSLTVAGGQEASFFGDLRLGAGSSVDIRASKVLIGAGGSVVARSGSSTSFSAPESRFDGTLRAEPDAAVSFAGTLWLHAPAFLASGATLTAAQSISNFDDLTVSSAQIASPLFRNRFVARFYGPSAIFGSFTNDRVTTIHQGTLFISGDYVNNGLVSGSICVGCSLANALVSPSLDIGGNFGLGLGTELLLPFPGSLVRVGGSFDAGIDLNTQFDLSLATLELRGFETDQFLEVMSTDIGPSPEGLDRSLPGHYPIGTLRIAPSLGQVRLIDARDNDRLGQAACEALYVDTLIIESGAHLANSGCAKIYYRTLVRNGIVDDRTKLIPIQNACLGDLNADDLVDDADFQVFTIAYDILDCTDLAMPAGCPADLNSDGIVDDRDFSIFAVAYDAVICP